MDDDFITPQQASELTCLSVPALAQLRFRGRGPTFYKPTERAVRYRRGEVLAWMEASSRQQTGSPVR